ncbi:MAG TPA: O-antigen ligase family protein [Alphaproteobacteria bacterium]|jgi:O-antigen ligase
MTSRPAAERRLEAYLTGVFSIVAFLLPPLAVFAPLGVAPATITCAVLVLAGLLWTRRRIALPNRTIFLALLALLAWSAIGLLWSISPANTVKTILQLAGIFASAAILLGGAALLTPGQARRVAGVLAAGIVLALALYAVEWLFDSPIQRLFRTPYLEEDEAIYSPFNRGLVLLLLTTAPAVIALWRAGRRRLAAGLYAAVAVVAYAYYGSSVELALTCGFIVILLVMLTPRRVMPVLGALFAACVLVAPVAVKFVATPDLVAWAGQRTNNFSAIHRLVIWEFATKRILEKPLTGWGLDTSRVMPGAKELVTITVKDTNSGKPNTPVERLPLHPHDMALQWWLELGLPGAVIAGFVIFSLFGLIARLPAQRIEKALLTAQATMAIVIGALGYGIWQSWWMCTMVMACVLSAVALRSAAQDVPRQSSLPTPNSRET